MYKAQEDFKQKFGMFSSCVRVKDISFWAKRLNETSQMLFSACLI